MLKIAVLLLLLPSLINAQVIKTIFGDIQEQNPLIVELLNHKAVQRLKDIDQSGPTRYFYDQFPPFSRYSHSVGVYALLKKYNLSIDEQIAGLMHDASHTAFSHLADYIMQPENNQLDSYQDAVHEAFLSKTGVNLVLQKYAKTLQNIDPKSPKYQALERQLPDMCADRIEYNLHTAKVFHDLNDTDINAILAALKYENNQWYFTDLVQAKKFAKLSTYYTRNFWGSSSNAVSYVIFGNLVKYAIAQQIITVDNFQFGVDADILDKLNNSSDPVIIDGLKILKNVNQHYIVVQDKEYDAYFKTKMRGIDPLVLHNNKLHHLSELSLDFKEDLTNTALLAKAGIKLKFVGIENPKLMQLLSGRV